MPCPRHIAGSTASRRASASSPIWKTLDLIDKTEDIIHAVPHDEKTKTVVLEPYLTEQWYLNVETLAAKAIKAVEDGSTTFVPEQWANVYFNWMRNIQPWCISRQLWWGHQIPAWYGDDGTILRRRNRGRGACASRRARPSRRDPDVLDTWFSSALWPFSTLGWPEQTPELKRFYPTSVLVTGFDIIFFWVARMMMMGLHFMDDVPFHDVFIHTRVLDEKGTKMSKTKGNVVDPVELIDEYGADALRFALAIAAGQGRDIRMGAQPRRDLPQFRHQTVERRALLRDERMRARPDVRAGTLRGHGQPLDPRRGAHAPPPP